MPKIQAAAGIYAFDRTQNLTKPRPSICKPISIKDVPLFRLRLPFCRLRRFIRTIFTQTMLQNI